MNADVVLSQWPLKAGCGVAAQLGVSEATRWIGSAKPAPFVGQ